MLDNTVSRLMPDNASIEILNNTKQQLVNFDEMLNNAPHKRMPLNANNFGSAKHAYSI